MQYMRCSLIPKYQENQKRKRKKQRKDPPTPAQCNPNNVYTQGNQSEKKVKGISISIRHAPSPPQYYVTCLPRKSASLQTSDGYLIPCLIPNQTPRGLFHASAPRYPRIPSAVPRCCSMTRRARVAYRGPPGFGSSLRSRLVCLAGDGSARRLRRASLAGRAGRGCVPCRRFCRAGASRRDRGMGMRRSCGRRWSRAICGEGGGGWRDCRR